MSLVTTNDHTGNNISMFIMSLSQFSERKATPCLETFLGVAEAVLPSRSSRVMMSNSMVLLTTDVPATFHRNSVSKHSGAPS